MIPLRLLVLVALCYAAWAVLRKIRHLQQNARPTQVVDETGKTKPNSKTAQASPDEAQDQLVEDPVCHLLVPKKEAVRLRLEHTTWYFCSDRCCDQFIRETEQEKK